MAGKTKARNAEAEEVNRDAAMEDAPTSGQGSAKAQEEDDPMQEDGEGENGEGADEEEKEEPQRVRMLPGSTDTAASYEFLKEGHTLGNALRYIIMKNPDVEFCAYAIPHPSEDKMNLRIQTYDTTTSSAALAKGLEDLEDLCDVVSEEFWSEREKFMATQK
ncbi:DNA-directed RNA polymerase [Xylariomycetidae sp. FL0641]|nr:DNA-directed RNA polymerase [Xylariomycetidae sp. FL0641]